jgi:hypothetical protein
MSSLAHALKSLYPTSEFAIEDNDIGKIRWIKNQPEGFDFTNVETGEELKAAKLAELQVEVTRLTQLALSLEYQQKRRYEYPPLADLADAVYWQSEGDNTKMTAYLAAVEAVKVKYPKDN